MTHDRVYRKAIGAEEAWAEIGSALAEFEGPGGFSGPCRLVVAAGVKDS